MSLVLCTEIVRHTSGVVEKAMSSAWVETSFSPGKKNKGK